MLISDISECKNNITQICPFYHLNEIYNEMDAFMIILNVNMIQLYGLKKKKTF